MASRLWFVLTCVSLMTGCRDVKSPPAQAVVKKTVVDVRPTYSERSVVASGSQMAGKLAPGRIASIYGEHLGPAGPCSASPDPVRRETPSPLRPQQTLIETQVFPVSLCDTEVRVGGVPAGLLYVSAEQINFKMPQQTAVQGTTEIQVIHQSRPGPTVVAALESGPVTDSAKELAAEMWKGFRAVKWQRTYQPGPAKCRSVPAHQNLRFGLQGQAYYCAQPMDGVIAETFYFPIDPEQPKVLLLRADFRLDGEYPEISAEVEQLLIRQLTEAYGARTATDRSWIEIGAGYPDAGSSWQAGDVTVFLHRNPSYTAPAGIRLGVQLIAVRREVLEERERSRAVEKAFQMSSTLSPVVMGADLERDLGGKYLASIERPSNEEQRARAARETLASMVRLLPQAATGDRARRAAILVASDDLAVRLGGYLVQRSHVNGGEHLEEAPEAGPARRQLARFGVKYTGFGHYSGDVEYDRSLLRRAWKEFADTPWGQRAFLMLQRMCSMPELECRGQDCFLAVIKKGEKLLQDYPETQFRVQQLYHMAQAHETAWALSQTTPDDPSADGYSVAKSVGERSRLRAIEIYGEIMRLAPDTAEARAGQLSLPRLKLSLSTGERAFYCVGC